MVVFRVNCRKIFCKLLVNVEEASCSKDLMHSPSQTPFFKQVLFFEKTLHLVNFELAKTLGCNIIIRKQKTGQNLLSYLVSTLEILDVSNDALDSILAWQSTRVSKNTTKAMKVRRLLDLPLVSRTCSREAIDAILRKLAEQDERKKKKTSNMSNPTCPMHLDRTSSQDPPTIFKHSSCTHAIPRARLSGTS